MGFCVGNDASSVICANDVSMGKLPDGRKPNLAGWKSLLLAEHSSLEFSDFFLWSYVGEDGRILSHLVRHTKGHPRFVVQSQREDWTGEARPPVYTPRKFLSKWTPYAWIQMARQRLCMKAADYTRHYIANIKKKMGEDSNIYFQGLAWASVPECVFRAGCPYGKWTCGWWDRNSKLFAGKDIENRYDVYAKGECV